MGISENIKRLREEKGISQSKFAELIGMERTNYFRLEKRGNKLTIEQLEKIAGALGVSVIELLTGEEQKVQDSEEVERLKEKIKELESDKAYLQSSIDFLEEDKEFNRNFLKDIVKKLGSYIADVKDSNYTELLNDPEFKGLEYTVNFLTEMFKFIKDDSE